MIRKMADGGNKWGISTLGVWALQIVPLVSFFPKKIIRPFLAFKILHMIRANSNIFPIQSHKL